MRKISATESAISGPTSDIQLRMIPKDMVPKDILT